MVVARCLPLPPISSACFVYRVSICLSSIDWQRLVRSESDADPSIGVASWIMLAAEELSWMRRKVPKARWWAVQAGN